MKSKKLSVAEVKESGNYRPVKELRFDEIIFFVLEHIRLRNAYTLFYYFINTILIGFLAALSINGFAEETLTFNSFMVYFGWGTLAGSIIIIPFHEGLHALAFLLIGARKIKFGADFKQMIFYATAENFVAGRKGFNLIALFPFAIINIASIPFIIFGGIELRLAILTMLLLHNIMCIGDFAMLSFFRENRDRELYTFDDLETKTAWFYERKT